MKKFLIFGLCLSASLFSEDSPPYLYKVVSLQDWEASQSQSAIQLPPSDGDFIHFSRDDQLERIVTKYWNGIPYVLLKIAPDQLPGKMVYEANPGGSAKYYHLYDGSIPIDSVIESKVILPNSFN